MIPFPPLAWTGKTSTFAYNFHETSAMPPSALSPIAPPHPHQPSPPPPPPAPALAPAHAATPLRDFPSLADAFDPHHMSDLERKADDIIANFRARHQTGFD